MKNKSMEKGTKKRWQNFWSVIFVTVIIVICLSSYICLEFNKCLEVTNKDKFSRILVVIVMGSFTIPLGSVISSFIYCSGLKEKIDQLKDDKFFDPETGMYMKGKMISDFKMVAGREVCYIYACDIDNLKAVNDNYGHEAGDSLISTFASRLREFTASNSNVNAYRLNISGDEFAVVVFGDEEEYDKYDSLLKNIFTSSISITYRDNCKMQSISLPLTVSYAAMKYDPSCGKGVEEVFYLADQAMMAKKHEHHLKKEKLVSDSQELK